MISAKPTALSARVRVILVARLSPLDCLPQFPWRPVADRSTFRQPEIIRFHPPAVHCNILSCVFDVTAGLHLQGTVTVRWFLLVEDVQEMIMMNNCWRVIGGKCLKARVLAVLPIAWFYMVARDATACPLKRLQLSTYKSQGVCLFPCRWIWTFENAFLPFNS